MMQAALFATVVDITISIEHGPTIVKTIVKLALKIYTVFNKSELRYNL